MRTIDGLDARCVRCGDDDPTDGHMIPSTAQARGSGACESEITAMSDLFDLRDWITITPNPLGTVAIRTKFGLGRAVRRVHRPVHHVCTRILGVYTLFCSCYSVVVVAVGSTQLEAPLQISPSWMWSGELTSISTIYFYFNNNYCYYVGLQALRWPASTWVMSDVCEHAT